MFTVSVIISTYNGASKISELLEGLIIQTFSDFELVVVIDGSTDNTVEILQGYRAKFKNMKIVSQPNQGRSKVRNRGVRESTGDILIFYDDDMTPFADSVERHVKLQHEREVLVTGDSVEFYDKSKTDIQNYKASRTVKWTARYSDTYTSLSAQDLFFTASNCSISRTLFERLDGFDERLTDAEDYNLAQRALQMDMSVIFDRDNKALHRDKITARSYILRQRQYKVSHQQLRVLFPELINPRPPVRNVIKNLIYLFFARAFWVKAIDSGWLFVFPRAIRYKLYDIIIHALSARYPETRI